MVLSSDIQLNFVRMVDLLYILAGKIHFFVFFSSAPRRSPPPSMQRSGSDALSKSPAIARSGNGAIPKSPSMTLDRNSPRASLAMSDNKSADNSPRTSNFLSFLDSTGDKDEIMEFLNSNPGE